MAKAKMSFDKVQINLKALNRAVFETLAEQLAHDINARLNSEIGKGKTANGRRLKQYKESYKKAIRKGKVRAGNSGARKVSTSPTNLTITGDLLGSKIVRRIKGGAEIRFFGQHYSGISNAELAQSLIKRRFTGWHLLGQKDREHIDKQTAKFAEGQLDVLVQIKKAT